MGLLDYTLATFIQDSESSQRYNATWGNKVEQRLQLLSRVNTEVSNTGRVIQIDGSGVPILPDAVSGTVYKSNFATVDGFIGGTATVSVSNGIMAITGAKDAYKTKTITLASNSTTRVEYKSSVPLYIINSSFVRVASLPASSNWITVDFLYTSSSVFGIALDESGTGYVRSIYTGTGLYTSLVYDKGCCNRAINTGAMPVRGPKGFGLNFTGASFLQFDDTVIGSTGTISFKFKRATVGTVQTLFSTDSGTNNGCYAYFSAANGLIFATSNGSVVTNTTLGTISDTTIIHSLNLNLTSGIAYIDGVQVATIPTANVVGLTNLFIGCSRGTSSFYGGVIYDFIYATSSYGIDNVLAYYNGLTPIDAQQKSITNIPHSIPVRDSKGNIRQPGLPVYADNAAATTGGLIAGEQYRTSTGSLMVVY